MDKISNEVAQAEFDRWFDARMLPKTRRIGDAEVLVKEMVCAIEEGFIVINDDNSVELNLREPLTEPVHVPKLKFKSRITVGALQSKRAHIKADDNEGRQIATIAALTDEVGGTIRALGTIDYSLAGVISAFY